MNSYAGVLREPSVDIPQGEPIQQGGIHSQAKQRLSTTLDPVDPEPFPRLWMSQGAVDTDKRRQVNTLQALPYVFEAGGQPGSGLSLQTSSDRRNQSGLGGIRGPC